jgi:DNA-binding NtrC family response regulator
MLRNEYFRILNSSTMKIKTFIVEDNPTEGLMMQLAFNGMESIETYYYTTGKELLDNLDKKPEIVVVDMVLPDIHGLDIIKVINQKLPFAKIIVVSADERAGLIAQAQSEGIFNYIVKSDSCLRYLRIVMEDLLVIVSAKK